LEVVSRRWELCEGRGSALRKLFYFERLGDKKEWIRMRIGVESFDKHIFIPFSIIKVAFESALSRSDFLHLSFILSDFPLLYPVLLCKFGCKIEFILLIFN
jgi:hypothetical protein